MVTAGKLTEEDIDYWTPIVNEEYGLSDKNHITREWFYRMMPALEIIQDDKHYICFVRTWGMWGDNELTIISLYIKPEYRTLGMIRKTQREILELAKSKNIRYIYQGSHLNKKYDKLLQTLGYKQQVFRLEI